MKVRLLSIILLIVIIILMYLSVYPKKIRPITIQVIDGTTQKPIENCVVYYFLQTGRTKHLLGLKGIDYFDYRYRVEKKYYTDSNGTIMIPERKIYLKLYEEPLHEYIYINVEKNVNNIADFFKVKDIITQHNHLKGVMLYTTVDEFISDSSLPVGAIRIGDGKVSYEDKRINKEEKFLSLVKEKSLAKELEEIIIELPAF